jgi:hypothetical protein
MTWPNVLPNSAAFDADADSVAASRPELKKMSDAVNTLASNVFTGGSTTGTITPDVANGEIQRITLTGNITMNAFANPVAGQRLTMIFKQPAAGSTFDLSSTMLWENGAESLTQINGAVDTADIVYDGTNYFARMNLAHGSVEVYNIGEFTVVGDDSSGSLFVLGNTLKFTGGAGTTVSVANDEVTISAAISGLTNPLNANFDVNDFAIVNNVVNGHIDLTPNGTGDVRLNADTVRVGDLNATGTITTNGTAASFLGALVLNTNSGTNSGSITIQPGVDQDIIIQPFGTGNVNLNADTVRVGDSGANATITTNGAGDLILNTNAGTNSGNITIPDGTNANITISPNGTGNVGLQSNTIVLGKTIDSDVLLTTNGSSHTGDLIINNQNGVVGTSQIILRNNDQIEISATLITLTNCGTFRGGNAGGDYFAISSNFVADSAGGGHHMPIILGPDFTNRSHIKLNRNTNNTSSYNIEINPYGTGSITCNDKIVKKLQLEEVNYTVHNGGNIAGPNINFSGEYPIQRVRLTGNVTFKGFFQDAKNGQKTTVFITQDGTGSRTFSEGLDSANRMLFVGGDKTLTTTPNATDMMHIIYADGTYYCHLLKNLS